MDNGNPGNPPPVPTSMIRIVWWLSEVDGGNLSSNCSCKIRPPTNDGNTCRVNIVDGEQSFRLIKLMRSFHSIINEIKCNICRYCGGVNCKVLIHISWAISLVGSINGESNDDNDDDDVPTTSGTEADAPSSADTDGRNVGDVRWKNDD